MVRTGQIRFHSKGNCDILDITSDAQAAVRESRLQDGISCLFIVGSTAALTTVEFEPGLVKGDLPRLFEQLAPRDAPYAHEAMWNDDNGHSHVCASLLGPSLSIPFTEGKLILGTWQQVVAVDFDTRARERTVVVQMVGE